MGVRKRIRKTGVCPKCGYSSGINPYTKNLFTKLLYEVTFHKIYHHKCKKCLWQGYVWLNNKKPYVNRLANITIIILGLVILLSITYLVFKLAK